MGETPRFPTVQADLFGLNANVICDICQSRYCNHPIIFRTGIVIPTFRFWTLIVSHDLASSPSRAAKSQLKHFNWPLRDGSREARALKPVQTVLFQPILKLLLPKNTCQLPQLWDAHSSREPSAGHQLRPCKPHRSLLAVPLQTSFLFDSSSIQAVSALNKIARAATN